MGGVGGIADREIEHERGAEDERARRQRRQPRRDHGAGHFSRQPSARAAATSGSGSSVPASPRPAVDGGAIDARGVVQQRAELAPPRRRRGQADRQRGRLLHERVGRDAGRQRAVAHAIDHRGHRVRRRRHQRLHQHRALIAPQQLQRRRVEVRGDRRHQRRLGDAEAAERVAHAARVARLEAVLPAQRLERRAAHGDADDLAQLHVRAGRGQRRRAAGRVERRRDAVLIGAGAGRQIRARRRSGSPAATAPRSWLRSSSSRRARAPGRSAAG